MREYQHYFQKLNVIFILNLAGYYNIPTFITGKLSYLIERLLIVDPFTRYTIPEIRRLGWFLQDLPPYISVPPTKSDMKTIPKYTGAIKELQSIYSGIPELNLIDFINAAESNPVPSFLTEIG